MKIFPCLAALSISTYGVALAVHVNTTPQPTAIPYTRSTGYLTGPGGEFAFSRDFLYSTSGCVGCFPDPGPPDLATGSEGSISITIDDMQHGTCYENFMTFECNWDKCKALVTIEWLLTDPTYTTSCMRNLQTQTYGCLKPKLRSGTGKNSQEAEINCGATKEFIFQAGNLYVSTWAHCTECVPRTGN
jgi:hypothetical protein